MTDEPLLTFIESPYAGDIEANEAYARRCLADSLARGEAPCAGHLLYTQPGILDDTKPEERAKGMASAFAWARAAQAARVFYMDRGVSSGMLEGFDDARRREARIALRWIDPVSEIAVSSGGVMIVDQLFRAMASARHEKMERAAAIASLEGQADA